MSDVVRLSPLVRRITASNSGPMTGAGTNSYLIGDAEVAVIDPGPAEDRHIENILQAAAGRIKWIFVTHTHADHSPAASMLAKASGGELRGCVLEPDDGHQDTSFKVDHNLTDGELLDTSEFSLQAVHTPGHVGNHVCYRLKNEGMLFAGDHIMNGSTVVIIPPSGDMRAYLESLRKLKQLPLNTIAPGHGEPIQDAIAEIDGIVSHRLMREEKVVEALGKAGESSLEQLVPLVYDDVDKSLHRVASYSLWAHLLKLEKDGVAEKTIEKHWAFGEEHWRLH